MYVRTYVLRKYLYTTEVGMYVHIGASRRKLISIVFEEYITLIINSSVEVLFGDNAVNL